jgi:hypothetical protein
MKYIRSVLLSEEGTQLTLTLMHHLKAADLESNVTPQQSDTVFGERIAGAVSLGERIIDLHRSFLQENQDRGELLLRHDRPP